MTSMGEAGRSTHLSQDVLAQGATLFFQRREEQFVSQKVIMKLTVSLDNGEGNSERQLISRRDRGNFTLFLIPPISSDHELVQVKAHASYPIIERAISDHLREQQMLEQERSRRQVQVNTFETENEADSWYRTHVTDEVIIRLNKVGYRMLGNNPETIEDLIQQTLLLAYRFRSKFQEGTNFAAWVQRILHNQVVNHVLRNTNLALQAESLQDEVNMSPDIINSLKHGREHPFVVQSAEEDLLNREPNEEVIVALNNLPANFRTVLIAVDVMGMSYKEAAEYLDIPIGTVMSRLNRARTAVQKSLVKANSPLIKEYKKKDK